MTREKVLELGFKEIPHFTIGNSLLYNLGRRRHLSLSNLATPNEMLVIGELDSYDDKKVTSAVVLHNYNYDGYLTEEKLSLLLTFFAQKQ